MDALSHKIKKGADLILQGLRDDLNVELDENFIRTPDRYEHSLLEILEGEEDTDRRLDELLSSNFPADGYEGIIFSSGIETFSLCPHHLLPVVYSVSVAYMPNPDNGRILGLSKINRVVELLSHRAVLQEKLTKDIVRAMDRIDPAGVAVLIRGTHFCMKMRGVRTINANVITSDLTGLFLTDGTVRNEFYEMIKMSLGMRELGEG